MKKVTKKQISEFRKELEKELRNINAEKGQNWFTEEEIQKEAYESPDYTISEQIQYGASPRAYADVLSLGQ